LSILNPNLKRIESKLEAALPDHYPDKIAEPESDLLYMVSSREEWAYIVGLFMGAKLAGAHQTRS
jgi:hypothetical protein